ncbi:MAG: hypothetical protein E6J11_21400, partial [Chloroflexi bacterium]
NEYAIAAKSFADEVGASVHAMVDSIGPIKMKSRTEWLLGTQAAPNYRGVVAALSGGETPSPVPAELNIGHAGTPVLHDLLAKGAEGIDVLYICDAEFSERAKDPVVIANLRKAKFLIVHSWDATHPLNDVADVVLPSTIHAEKDGTFVNMQNRAQQIFAAYPPKGQALGDEEIFARIQSALADDGAAALAGRASPAEAGAP